jgi:pyruvate/2-oxoglutarate/acetoin dehydrogenase E1 component
MGLRPVVEFMFMDFMALAMDQLANHAAKISFMYGGQTGVPLVVRAPFGAGRGYGASHSQSLEAWMVNVPGLKVVAASNPADAKGLLKAAIRDNNPVVFLEHKLVYPVKGRVNDGPADKAVRGRSVVVRRGSDVTLVGYAQQLVQLLKVADELATRGVSAEVVDVPVLKPLDLTTAFASVRKTGRAVVVEEGPELCGVGSEIAQRIYTHCFADLACPIAKFSGRDTPIPSAMNLERHYLPQLSDIIECVERLLGAPDQRVVR